MHKAVASTLAVALMLWPVAATTNQIVAERYILNAREVGSGVLTYLFWDVYKATLYAAGLKWRLDKPFALTFRYMRDLKGRDIAERTIEEIREQGFADEVKLSDWASRLTVLFPDVADGDSLTAVRDTAGRTLFFSGSKKIGAIDDVVFGPHFFDIWLGEKTSQPKLRRKLLGG